MSHGPREQNHPAPPLAKRRPFSALLVLALACGFALGLSVMLPNRWSRPDSRALPPPSKGDERDHVLEAESLVEKPWGHLEIQNMTMERPSEFVPEIPLQAAQTCWYFGSLEPAQIQALFASCDLTDSERAILSNTNRWHWETNGWSVLPGTNLAWNLNRPARQQIYDVLARYPENRLHQVPFRFPLAREEEWLENSGLAPETVDVAYRLMYRRGSSICFSDIEILSVLSSERERRRLVRTLSRLPAVFVNLQVNAQTRLDPIIEYWEAVKPRQDTQPFLESLSRLPGGSSINITYFLPPFARTRIYDYPDGRTDDQNTGEDCFWAAMNFFNTQPDDRFADPQQRISILARDYAEIEGNLALGDIILLINRHRIPFHACVYIADRVVFTKNGGTRNSPCLLMRMSDMLSYYNEIQPMRLAILRSKGRQPPRVSPEAWQAIQSDLKSLKE